MLKTVLLAISILVVLSIANAWSVDVNEDNDFIKIQTAGYEAWWRKPSIRSGYIQIFVAGSQESITGMADRTFFHSSQYAGGWKHWGPLLDWEIIEEVPGKTVIRYESADAGTKEYICIASYYDSVPYIKHEVTITNTGADPVTSFQNGHEPMFEPNRDFEGMQSFDQPFPHVAYWVEEGYFAALYGPDAQQARTTNWQDRNPGRMDLMHDNLGEELKKGESATVTYYVAFGEGDEKEATELAEDVTKEPPLGGAISSVDTVATTWGWVRNTKQVGQHQ